MKILIADETATQNVLKRALEKKSLSISIEFDQENIIGLEEVKRLMTLYKEMLLAVKEKKERRFIRGYIIFHLFNQIRNFDLTFIAALNLIKLSVKNITIHLVFDRIVQGSEEESCFFRFGHFLTAGFLVYGSEIYSIIRDGKASKLDFLFENLSGYLPFIYVDKGIFQGFFHNPFRETWDKWWNQLDLKAFENLRDKKNQAEKIYQELRDETIHKIKNSRKNLEQNLLNFFNIYLFNAVRKFQFIKKILKNQSQDDRFKSAGISIDEFDSRLGIHLSKDGDRQYEKEIQYIFDKILDKPPAFVVLFSYFIDKFYNPRSIKNADDAEKIKIRIELISNIFYFTDEIFFGARELAKNIIEHSSNGRGVIMGRVVNKKDLPGLKKGMCVEEYLKGREESEFIDLIVMDDGDMGIIETTIKNLKVLKTEFKNIPEVVNKFESDIDNLATGKIALPDFYNPDDIKLNYQEIRSALSLGLLIFSHLVLDNNGYMIVSSPNQNKINGLVLFAEWEKRKELEEIVPLGTFYNILFPKNLKQPLSPRGEIVPFEMPSGESAFNKLFKLSLCSKSIDNKEPEFLAKGINGIEEMLCLIDFSLEEDVIKKIDEITNLLNKCKKCPRQKNIKILALDFKRVPKLDPADLFRFLAKIQMAKDVKSIIVHNVKEDIVEGIIKLFEIFNKMGLRLGSNDHFVLFYYLKKEQEGDYFYLFLLAGETWDDLAWINEKISKINYTEDILQKYGNHRYVHKPSPQFRKDFYLNPLFTNDGHLLPFDVLLKSRGLTLFERNVLADLNKPAGDKASRSYKFENAHVRLGSKIHLKDFFYARRIFQNSFYSLRFAYLVSSYIESNFNEWNKINKNNTKQLTIVGYGMYSKLLISNVARFFKRLHSDWEIDHALVEVDEDESFKIIGEIIQNVILIIPISSTLSTSLKIVLGLNLKHTNLKFMGNPINIMIVGNGGIKDIIGDRDKGIVLDPTVGKFWSHLDAEKKMVTSTPMGKLEKFFLYLSTRWYLPQNCAFCFPENPENEIVLFETYKISVTPSLIFDLPQAKVPTPLSKTVNFSELEVKTISEQKEAILTEDMLEYGHITRGNNHYLYYIETADFLKKNKQFVVKWLLEVKDNLKDKNDVFESRLFLIAPAHFTNADFTNLVNEVIFNDAATLLHYDQDEDYSQNLKSFFGEDITGDSYVFYIDDAVGSGGTFHRINNFVKYARSNGYSRGVDGAFVLINRLTHDKNSIILEESPEFLPLNEIQKQSLKNQSIGFFSFIDLEVPIMIDPERFCYLCSERKRYARMIKETILDSLRILIKAKIIKLEEAQYTELNRFESDEDKSIEWKYITKEKCIFGKTHNKKNYLKRLEFVHKLYRGFSNEEIKLKIKVIFNNNGALETFCREVKFNHPEARLTEDEKVNIIKVLSNPYFVYHKEIKKYIFRTVLMELEKTIQILLQIPSNRNLDKGDMNMYRYLKFLIKRAAMLKANYIIRDEVLKKIINLNDVLRMKLENEIVVMSQDEKKHSMPYMFLNPDERDKFKVNLDGFIDYYIMAVKEVIWLNESKSLKLEETLDGQIFSNNNAIGTKLLTDSLRIENTSILCRFLKSMEKHISYIPLSFSEQNYIRDINRLSELVISFCKDDPYRSAPLLLFLGFNKIENGIKDESQKIKLFLETNNTFKTKILPMLLLKAFFLNEKEKTYLKQPGMDYILYCLCKILDINIESGGALLVVKYIKTAQPAGKDDLFTISHIGKHREIDSFNWDHSFTSRIFSGWKPFYKSLPLTYLQLLKKEEILYTHYGEKIEKEDIAELDQLDEMKNFLFLRLADDDLDSTARGVIVLYNQEAIKIAPENLRYAMILKNDIFEFIKKNYENYSFKLYEEKIHQLKGLESLNAVIAKITAAADFDEVYQAVQDTRVNIPNIDEMCLLIRKEKDFESISKCTDLDKHFCRRCTSQKLDSVYQKNSYIPYYCSDVNKDNSLKKLNREELKTSFIIPLVFKKDLLGILEIWSQKENAFSTFERNLLTSLGSQVAIAINNRIKQEKQGEIYRDISHSLGAYLTTMRAYSQRIIEGKVTDEAKKVEYLKRLYGDAFWLINSVDEISSLANMEYCDISSISEKLEINEVVSNLATRNKFLLEEKQLVLQISNTIDKVYVKADKQKLEEAFQSLLNNAIKFSDKNKKINIRVSTDRENVFIKMEDQGYGIDKDDLERIFGKYERGQYAIKEKIVGTGIGLAAAKSIIEKHSGEISVESELGKGSTFTIKLPIAKENTLHDINKKEDKK